MRISLALLLLAWALGGAGCAVSPTMAPVVPPVGCLFTCYSAPLTTDARAVPFGTRIGEAKTQYLRLAIQEELSLVDFAWGDGSIERAARNGNITRVDFADYEYVTVLGIYSSFTVRAYGD